MEQDTVLAIVQHSGGNQDLSKVLIIQSIATIAIVGTFIVYAWQLWSMRKTRQSHALLNVVQMLSEPELRKARKILISHAEIQLENWSDETKEKAERVCVFYDIVDILIQNKVITPNIIEENWGDSIKKCHEVASELIREIRKTRGEKYWDGFDRLYKRVIGRTVKQKVLSKNG